MKKILSFVVCLAMVLSMMVVPAMADAAFSAGTYTATAQGNAAMFGDLYEQGYAFAGDTLEDVAKAAHLPVDTFVATVARYNELKGQEDVDFGKPAAAMTGVGEGPYTALRIMPATIGTIGGLKIDLDAHVLDTNGNAIAGLYAAGACANGEFFYREYPASGTSIQMCFTIGRIAGSNAAAQK